MEKLKLMTLALGFLWMVQAPAACIIHNSDGAHTEPKADILYKTLTTSNLCPESVQELKSILVAQGLSPKAAMVANRGRNNPDFGSFSFFESVVGSSEENSLSPKAVLFFGHFTGAENGMLALDQSPDQGKLMIELISWDTQKKYYNFYELIGNGSSADWFYRGDTRDILADNENLYLGPQGQVPQFGSRLRCSGCHSSGGPIMKELLFPHNDWWSPDRHLQFGKNIPSKEVSGMVSQLMDSDEFSVLVRDGIDKLAASPSYQALKTQGSRQALLRPLFCETEINLESDPNPGDKIGGGVQIPGSSILNPFLGSGNFLIQKDDYKVLLNRYLMKFPETAFQDADHPWLVPVKGYSDLKAIQMLIDTKMVDLEFVLDVLSIDSLQPLFSQERCSLLKLVPEGDHWLERFIMELKKSPQSSAQELAKNLTDASRNVDWHLEQARQAMADQSKALTAVKGRDEQFQKLLKQRQSVFESEISKNKRGQILEPGFRVIFPKAFKKQID